MLYKEHMQQTARIHLIMSIWLPLAVWIPVYIAMWVLHSLRTGR